MAMTVQQIHPVAHLPLVLGVLRVLSQSSIFGQNPKIWCQEFNDLQTPKLSKKQLCEWTHTRALQAEQGVGFRGGSLERNALWERCGPVRSCCQGFV